LRSCHVIDRPIIRKAVKYIDQSDNTSWHVFGFDTLSFRRLITDWSVENMNPDMIP